LSFEFVDSDLSIVYLLLRLPFKVDRLLLLLLLLIMFMLLLLIELMFFTGQNELVAVEKKKILFTFNES
jgi:hypothetical protein